MNARKTSYVVPESTVIMVCVECGDLKGSVTLPGGGDPGDNFAKSTFYYDKEETDNQKRFKTLWDAATQK
jgi:hypothetical protein